MLEPGTVVRDPEGALWTVERNCGPRLGLTYALERAIVPADGIPGRTLNSLRCASEVESWEVVEHPRNR